MRINNIRDKSQIPIIKICGIYAVFFLAVVVLSAGCNKKSAPPKKEAVPVLVAQVKQSDVPLQLQAVGNVEAYSTVYIKAQSGGTLSRVHFKEGHDVNQGDVLFTIDTRSYHAQLRQAEAALAKSTAQLENAMMEAKRYEDLIKKGYVAQSDYDKVRTNAWVLEATVKSDKAAADNARLMLDYCVIRSPITGRTGNLTAHEGDLIKANADSSMVVINRIQPVYVSFTVPERHLPDIKKYIAKGKVIVEAILPGSEKNPEKGHLSFIDNAVDTATGSILLKATFSNSAKHLWPGQFVNVTVNMTTEKNAILIPSHSIQTGQQGTFVFVVKPDMTAEIRPVGVRRTVGGDSVVEPDGLKPGENIVIDGQSRLVPGAKVEIKNEDKKNQDKKK